MAAISTNRLLPQHVAELRHHIKVGNVVRTAGFLALSAVTAATFAIVGSQMRHKADSRPAPEICNYTAPAGWDLSDFASLADGASVQSLARLNHLTGNGGEVGKGDTVKAPCSPALAPYLEK